MVLFILGFEPANKSLIILPLTQQQLEDGRDRGKGIKISGGPNIQKRSSKSKMNQMLQLRSRLIGK